MSKEHLSETLDKFLIVLLQRNREAICFRHDTTNHKQHLQHSSMESNTPGMEEFIKPLDDVINEKFIPSLIDDTVNEIERALFSLPIQHGGLSIPTLTEKARNDYVTSKKLTAPLVSIMILQGKNLPDENVVKEIREKVHN